MALFRYSLFNMMMIVVAFQLWLGVPQANAGLEQWDLDNVSFGDGGKATGAFLIDTDLVGSADALIDYDITVSGGDTAHFPNFHWTVDNSAGELAASGLRLKAYGVFFDQMPDSNLRRLELNLDTVMPVSHSTTPPVQRAGAVIGIEYYTGISDSSLVRFATGRWVRFTLPRTTMILPKVCVGEPINSITSRCRFASGRDFAHQVKQGFGEVQHLPNERR
jgi:hypothetical protein